MGVRGDRGALTGGGWEREGDTNRWGLGKTLGALTGGCLGRQTGH